MKNLNPTPPPWPKKQQPTPRQLEVLTFIFSYHREHGWPPTTIEIADHFGFTRKTAWDYANTLERKEFLKPREYRCRRTIQLDTRKIGVKVTPTGIEFWRKVVYA